MGLYEVFRVSVAFKRLGVYMSIYLSILRKEAYSICLYSDVLFMGSIHLSLPY